METNKIMCSVCGATTYEFSGTPNVCIKCKEKTQ